jgi:lambda repressor-like predicted transcriptional regulator
MSTEIQQNNNLLGTLGFSQKWWSQQTNKHNEYSIVNQLKKTSGRISLMSLIMSSELHHNALQKVLNEAYVPQDITKDSIEHIVG